LNITIKKSRAADKRKSIWLPMEEDKLGKDLYLTEKMAVATKELDELDGESYAMDLINNNKSARVTPYGVLYENSNDPIQVYNGKQFHPMATVGLKAKSFKRIAFLR